MSRKTLSRKSSISRSKSVKGSRKNSTQSRYKFVGKASPSPLSSKRNSINRSTKRERKYANENYIQTGDEQSEDTNYIRE